MEFTILFVIAVLLLIVSVGFYKKNTIQEKELDELRQETENMKEHLAEQENNFQVIWNAANAIHLYASVCEEEIKSQDLKQRQTEIRELSEEILQLSNKR